MIYDHKNGFKLLHIYFLCFSVIFYQLAYKYKSFDILHDYILKVFQIWQFPAMGKKGNKTNMAIKKIAQPISTGKKWFWGLLYPNIQKIK